MSSTRPDFDVDSGEFALIQAIIRRATRDEGESELNAMTLSMDLAACHRRTPLDLERLLHADRFTFFHDIFGIMRHMNRKTGNLEGCFLPRCALVP